MVKVVSGIRSTGQLHLGNYMGALLQFVGMQSRMDCYFFIADYHALTTLPDPNQARQRVQTVLAEYLAAGLNPEQCTLYVQSDLPETAELYLLLNMHAYVGELERCTSFKDKVRLQPNNVNAGLLTYPVLMAADILLHKGESVPVGKDQEQNLEMARNFAQRFNHFYQTVCFPEPQPYRADSRDLAKVPGLDGSGKMGKSEGGGNAIFLAEDPSSIRKKIMRAVTDTGPTIHGSEPEGAVANLFQLLEIVSTGDIVAQFKCAYADCSIRYGDLKKQLADDMIQYLAPLRENILSLQSKPTELEEIRQMGAAKAKASAQKTLNEVRALMGF
ncbi:MAG: tryptophan--tRNA ligase [Sphingomonadales bacterium]|nr:tryptophan--tRNA ligase [Sphingomonadales bacterium]